MINKKDKLLTIGQFAAMHGINKKTLMWYDEIGLFKPAVINPENGYRCYNYYQSPVLETILLLRELEKRCAAQLSIQVSFKDSVRKWLAETGYDVKYGARPLKRAIQNKIEDVLADELLEGRIREGNHVDVKAVNGTIRITVRQEGQE